MLAETLAVLRRVAMVIAGLALVVMVADEYCAQWTWLAQQIRVYWLGGQADQMIAGLSPVPDAATTVTDRMGYWFTPKFMSLHCHESDLRPRFECGGTWTRDRQAHVFHDYIVRFEDGCGRLIYAFCADGSSWMRYDETTTRRKMARLLRLAHGES